MDNILEGVDLTYSVYGDGKARIEILNIGFEPLLFPEEYEFYAELKEIKKQKREIKHSISELEKTGTEDIDINEHNLKLLKVKGQEKAKEKQFQNMLKANIKKCRQIYDDRKFDFDDQFRDIAIFESDLTRCFGCKDMEHSDDIISVVTYYTEIFENIMKNGFNYKDRHFVFFTAGAGQTRNKKSTFVNEVLLNKHYNRLFCGLSRETINDLGGMNTNKYLAYTSLCQTNSEIWKDFNIDRAIVVDDIEYDIPDQTVRYIYTESPEDKKNIEELNIQIKKYTEELSLIKTKKKSLPKSMRRDRNEIIKEKQIRAKKNALIEEIKKIKATYHQSHIKKMSVTIPFTDGFGISLKKMQSSMVRLPFIKGLMAYCPRRKFIDWCSENNYSIKQITDIYGKKHSIRDVDYIFTKSQFKMWKYYNNIENGNGKLVKTGWEVYSDNFKQYKCDACRCNVERDVKLNSKTNYQILQTLTTEMTDEDIFSLAEYDIECLNGIGNNVNSMLQLLGADPEKNSKLNFFQQSLILYPELLKDFYVKTLLKNTKDSMINKFRSGKFNINGAYVFAIPDPLACLQWWFTDMNHDDLSQFGFVKKGNVACKLFEDKETVDCLRSPHLDHAHCIRKNQYDEETKTWVKSAGVYLSMQDIMSKLLMYDNDGDKLLVHNNETIIKNALSFQEKHGMIPNYYDMPKAESKILSNESLYNGIVLAYHHGNIGTPSNEITKIWKTLSPESTEEEIQHAIEVIALRCVDVNFTIDYAKTLYKPTIPKDILKKYKVYSGQKVPHFFIYAKGKRKDQVEDQGNCNIDRITDIVKSNRIVFKDFLGQYSYKKLMSKSSVNIKTEKAERIISLYRELESVNLRKLSHIDWDMLDFKEKQKIQLQIQFDTTKQRSLFVQIIEESPEFITDVLVKALQNDVNKGTLWRLFGDVIYKNLQKNLADTKICEKCGKRFEISNPNDHSAKYCSNCKKEIERDKKRKQRNCA